MTDSSPSEYRDDPPERLVVASSVVDTALDAPRHLAFAAACSRQQGELVVDQVVDAGVRESDIWPCVLVSLAGSRAVDRVEQGIEAAMADIESRLEGAQRAVVVCLADDDASCIRGFAGPLNDLAECSVEVL